MKKYLLHHCVLASTAFLMLALLMLALLMLALLMLQPIKLAAEDNLSNYQVKLSDLNNTGITNAGITNAAFEFKTKIPSPEAIIQKPAASAKCVLFDNMDGFHQLCYYQHIQNGDYASDFIKAPFSDAFFAQNNMTDFDLAIFPMGNYALKFSTVSGIKVIDKIMEMINAGKKVMITGKFMLFAQYRSDLGKDPAVKNFFENVLGIEYLGWRPTCDTADNLITFRQFVSLGAVKDPISIASTKECNVVMNGMPPLAYYYNVDVFKLNQGSSSFAVDHLTIDRNAPRNDTLLGCRAVINDKAKVVFWSYGFEVMSDYYGKGGFLTNAAIRWLLRAAPGEGANIELLPGDVVNFGYVEPGDSAFADVVVRNSGVEDLIINELYFYEWTDPGIYQIIGGLPELPITLRPDETVTMQIKFSPASNIEYMEFLEMKSNAVNSPQKAFQLKGTGGSGRGPIISVNETSIDFGEAAPLKQVYRDLVLKNIGIDDLIINIIKFDQNDDDVFNFPQGAPTPILAPNESEYYRLRFVPQEADKTYHGRIKIWSTATNTPELFIDVTGTCKISDVIEPEVTSSNGLLTMKAAPNPFSSKTIIQYSIGGNDVYNLEMFIVDINGKKVAEVLNKTVATGEYDVEIDAAALSSGNYYLVARINGSTASLPLILEK